MSNEKVKTIPWATIFLISGSALLTTLSAINATITDGFLAGGIDLGSSFLFIGIVWTFWTLMERVTKI